MEMKKYQELLYTVRSMDSHEIRYFKLFAKRHVIGLSNTYLKLFDFLLKSDDASDAQIRKYFSKEAFVKNLPSAKSYLLRLIQKSLYHYHDQEDPLSRIMRHLKLAEIYKNKVAFSLTESHLKKARRIAEKEEFFLFNLMISDMFIKNSLAAKNEDEPGLLISKEMGNEKNNFKLYLNLRQYQEAFIRFRSLEKRIFFPRTTTEKRSYELIMENEIFSSVSLARSKTARAIFYELKSSYQDKLETNPDQSEITEEVIDFFLSFPQFFRKNAGSLIESIHAFLSDLLQNEQFERYFICLKKFASLQAPTDILRSQITLRCAKLELEYAQIVSQDGIKVKEIIENATRNLKKINPSNSQQLILELYHFQTCLLFSKGQFKRSLKWNLKTFQNKTARDNQAFSMLSEMTFLIIQLRLGNANLVEKRITFNLNHTRDKFFQFALKNLLALSKSFKGKTNPGGKTLILHSDTPAGKILSNDPIFLSVFPNTNQPFPIRKKH